MMEQQGDAMSVSSPSARRAWVEIPALLPRGLEHAGSPSARRAWVEIYFPWSKLKSTETSPSARRAWVEIVINPRASAPDVVALRKEGVG